jgi:two-component system response regulator GlrR
LLTKAIHKASPRCEAEFVGVNCTVIPDTLFESEFFGHTKGVFSGASTSRKGLFEMANGGTLFLDEIGDMSLEFQAKLLRALEEREIRPSAPIKLFLSMYGLFAPHTNSLIRR